MRGTCGHERGQGVPVARVAGGEGCFGSEGPQFGELFLRAGGVRAAPGDQQQVPYAVGFDQPPGDETAQRAGGAGHQDGAVAEVGLHAPLGVVGEAGQAGSVHGGAAHDGVGFMRRPPR